MSIDQPTEGCEWVLFDRFVGIATILSKSALNIIFKSTFPDPAVVTPGGLDPRIMVPLVVGDYITFSGTKTEDGILEVYSLEANLGIYTAPGTQPAYIGVDAAQFAIAVPDPTVEVDETRSCFLGILQACTDIATGATAMVLFIHE